MNSPGSQASQAAPPLAAADGCAPFTESAVLLGPRRSLVGIVASPVGDTRREGPAVVILNTGIVHRVGHHRMYVDAARSLAAAGHRVLRFDFSGIGDSARRTDRLSLLESCASDIKEALDSFEASHRVSRFVLVGLCSGADHAVLYAPTDRRIVGLILLDPSIPPTRKYYFHYIVQRLCSPRNWFSVLTGRSGLLRLLASQWLLRARPELPANLKLEDLPFSPYLARCYADCVRHDTRMLAMFTSISSRRTYRQQMVDAFPSVDFANHLTQEFFPDSDHLFSALQDRARLNRIVLQWLDSPASEARSSSAEQAGADLPDAHCGRTQA